jgi:hypothetical protein
MDASNLCAQRIVSAFGAGTIDSDDSQAVLTRLSVIDGRSMLLLACLNVEEIEADFDRISLKDEVEFMDAAFVFIEEIQVAMEEGAPQ